MSNLNSKFNGDEKLATPIEVALIAYRDGQVSLSRAAELAGLGLRDLMLKLPENATELNYDLGELRSDLEEFTEASA